MAKPEDAFKTLKVLVIEDHEEMRRIICRMLQQIGVAAIVEAADGDSGFEEVLRARPDVVVCDIHMQPVNGETFLTWVRSSAIEEVRELPVLFLSGDHSVDTVHRAIEKRVDGYIAKPMRFDDLKKQLGIVIARRADRAKPRPA